MKKLRKRIIRIFHEIKDPKAYKITKEQKSSQKERRVSFLSMMLLIPGNSLSWVTNNQVIIQEHVIMKNLALNMSK